MDTGLEEHELQKPSKRARTSGGGERAGLSPQNKPKTFADIVKPDGDCSGTSGSPGEGKI